MQTIRSLRDMDKFGIIALTGEACQLGTRILCDLTGQGRAIVADCYGLNNSETTFPEAWNSSGVASCMIPATEWVTLAVIALHLDGAEAVFHFENAGIIGIYKSDLTDDCPDTNAWCKRLERIYGQPIRTYRSLGHPGKGTRCEHRLRGRIT